MAWTTIKQFTNYNFFPRKSRIQNIHTRFISTMCFLPWPWLQEVVTFYGVEWGYVTFWGAELFWHLCTAFLSSNHKSEIGFNSIGLRWPQQDIDLMPCQPFFRCFGCMFGIIVLLKDTSVASWQREHRFWKKCLGKFSGSWFHLFSQGPQGLWMKNNPKASSIQRHVSLQPRGAFQHYLHSLDVKHVMCISKKTSFLFHLTTRNGSNCSLAKFTMSWREFSSTEASFLKACHIGHVGVIEWYLWTPCNLKIVYSCIFYFIQDFFSLIKGVNI